MEPPRWVPRLLRCSGLRCTAGHTESVLALQFSPDGRHLASGSGDTTLRFWDLSTQTPLRTCKVPHSQTPLHASRCAHCRNAPTSCRVPLLALHRPSGSIMLYPLCGWTSCPALGTGTWKILISSPVLTASAAAPHILR
jgi:hypothetical protein